MIWEIDPTQSHAHALSKLSPRHFFLELGICPLFVLFDSPPTGLEMRLDNAATHLADAQSEREATALQSGKS